MTYRGTINALGSPWKKEYRNNVLEIVQRRVSKCEAKGWRWSSKSVSVVATGGMKVSAVGLSSEHYIANGAEDPTR